jgi:hypothetical protein
MTADQLDLFAMPTSTFDRGRQWTVRELGSAGGKFETARGWVERWHYSRRMPGGGTRTFGVFSIPNNVHGIATRYGLHPWQGNIEISRVVAHPDAPANTASRAVAALLKLYGSRGYEWLFSYADTGQGHHGGIYQALNGVYLGTSGERPGYLLNGEPVHPRSLVSTYGTQAWPAIRDIIATRTGKTLERVDGLNTAKHTYVLLCGNKTSRREIMKHLRSADLIKPYPKRSTEEGSP